MNFTFQQYADHEARIARGKQSKAAISSPACDKESALHDAILNECKRRRWLCFHGSMAHRAMRTSGEPDFTILADNARVFFVECKTKTGKLSPEQLAIKCWAEMLGHQIHVCRSAAEFLDVIEPNKKPPGNQPGGPTMNLNQTQIKPDSAEFQSPPPATSPAPPRAPLPE